MRYYGKAACPYAGTTYIEKDHLAGDEIRTQYTPASLYCEDLTHYIHNDTICPDVHYDEVELLFSLLIQGSPYLSNFFSIQQTCKDSGSFCLTANHLL